MMPITRRAHCGVMSNLKDIWSETVPSLRTGHDASSICGLWRAARVYLGHRLEAGCHLYPSWTTVDL